jgi:hypothetical protein
VILNADHYDIAAIHRRKPDGAVRGTTSVLLGVIDQVPDDSRERVAVEASAQIRGDIELQRRADPLECGCFARRRSGPPESPGFVAAAGEWRLPSGPVAVANAMAR